MDLRYLRIDTNVDKRLALEKVMWELSDYLGIKFHAYVDGINAFFKMVFTLLLVLLEMRLAGNYFILIILICLY